MSDEKARLWLVVIVAVGTVAIILIEFRKMLHFLRIKPESHLHLTQVNPPVTESGPVPIVIGAKAPKPEPT